MCVRGFSSPRALIGRSPRQPGPHRQFHTRRGFRGYYETSAKEGWNIAALRDAIREAIDWSALPKVSSNALFEGIKNFVDDEVRSHRVLTRTDDLYRLFLNAPKAPNLHRLCERNSRRASAAWSRWASFHVKLRGIRALAARNARWIRLGARQRRQNRAGRVGENCGGTCSFWRLLYSGRRSTDRQGTEAPPPHRNGRGPHSA